MAKVSRKYVVDRALYYVAVSKGLLVRVPLKRTTTRVELMKWLPPCEIVSLCRDHFVAILLPQPDDKPDAPAPAAAQAEEPTPNENPEEVQKPPVMGSAAKRILELMQDGKPYLPNEINRAAAGDNPRAAFVDGLRRLRELRKFGYIIDKEPNGYRSFCYRLRTNQIPFG